MPKSAESTKTSRTRHTSDNNVIMYLTMQLKRRDVIVCVSRRLWY